MMTQRRTDIAVASALIAAIVANLIVRWSSAAPPGVDGVAEASPPAAVASPAASPFAHSIERMAYHPSRVDIPAGATVTWVNRQGVPHTVTAPGELNSGRLDRDARFTHTFDEPGVYWYECFYHHNMSGLVVVRSAPE
ncbi:MAG: amidase [Thermomicrobiales bacterium]|nr:amidase [Thermomicrobiales bacterium]